MTRHGTSHYKASTYLMEKARNTIHVKDFQLDTIPPGSNILVIGRRGVGKSFLVTDLLRHKRDAVPVVFASKYVAQHYYKYLPHTNVLDHFDDAKLTRLLERQVDSGGAKEIVLAFDDITNGNTCLMDNTSVRDLVKYGSSLNVTSVFSVQHAAVFDETFRRNVDYVFLFHDNLKTNQTSVYERYGDMFLSEHDFQAIYKECTMNEPHRCLVIDMKTPWSHTIDGNHVPDNVYWYKANKHDDHADHGEGDEVDQSAQNTGAIERMTWLPSDDPVNEQETHAVDNRNQDQNNVTRLGDDGTSTRETNSNPWKSCLRFFTRTHNGTP